MKPAPFVYHRPQSLDEAIAILGEVSASDGRILAGGQTLAAMMAFRVAQPPHLVDINGIAALKEIRIETGAMIIGACVRHAAFEAPVESGPTGRLLSTVMRHIAHRPIRARGTFCGSLAHADPASEWCLVFATLDGEAVVRNQNGGRRIAAADYFQGVMMTALEPDEMLVEVLLPLLADDTRFGFEEFARRAGDFAIASVLVTLRLVGGRIADPRIGVGGAEASPRRIPAAERVLEGEIPGDGLYTAVAQAVADAIDPLEDQDNDSDYRRGLVAALTKRALQQAAAA
jgi:carbon-monoxide dehydrogenase medium subunit